MADPKRFLLRLDPALFEALRRWAKDDRRSINGQIEYLLTEQARRAGRLPHDRRGSTAIEPPATDGEPAGGEPAGGEPAGGEPELRGAARTRAHR